MSSRSPWPHLLPAGRSDKPLALGLLASEFAGAADRFGLFPVGFFGWLLVESSALHLAKHAFALHFLLEHTERLIDIVVADEDLQEYSLRWSRSDQIRTVATDRRSIVIVDQLLCRATD